MAEGPRLHPHILTPKPATSEKFTSPKSGRDSISFPDRGRKDHADKLLDQIREAEAVSDARVAEQKAEGVDDGNGIYLLFKSTPGFDLKFESLDVAHAGIELCAVRQLPDTEIQAAVFVPDGKLGYFLKKIQAYKDKDTKPTLNNPNTRPRNEDLVASIADIQLAALEALWTDQRDLYPDPDEPTMWEVWLRRGEIDHVARLRVFATERGLTVSKQDIKFTDRTIVLVHGRGRDLARSNDLLGAIAEVRLAKTTAAFFTSMNVIDQQAWIDDLAKRCTQPVDGSPYVCILDTGLNRAHPLIVAASDDADCHTYNPDWGPDDRQGHGTPMAGLVLFGDLTEPLANGMPVALSHRIESVKLINDADPHAKELYGAVTQECVSRVEIKPDRRRVYCMAVSASDTRDLGRPSSWSAAIDAMTSGYTDGERRLVVLSAGNTVRESRGDYPISNETDSIHDPAQSWNALTVGGYTEKALVDQSKYDGWEPLAGAGLLAPCSCTSMTWMGSKWPIKPDFVLEAGNMAKHADHAEPDYIDDALSLLSTPHDFVLNKPLVTFGDTSAAAALGARLAGMVSGKYKSLTPEAVRALLVHSCDWTDAMVAQCTDAQGHVNQDMLVRCYGYGVPNVRKLLSSADNSLTLIAQGEIHPFHLDGKDIKTRELCLHELPWPTAALEDLGPAEIEMRVTLSYFVEPNPGARGWSTKYSYQSHGLRFDVKRARESVERFRKSINKAAREVGYDDNRQQETGRWRFAANSPLSALGSLRSNVWTGQAADLAARGLIAVYPTYGWWNKRPNLKGYEKSSHYTLVVTITTPETDIYTPVANAISLPIVVEV